MYFSHKTKLSHNPLISMASIRRLSDDDVRAIFECVHNNTNAPSHLPFQIVPVGTDGLKLSPPSFQFDGGFQNHHEDSILFAINTFTFLRRWSVHLA